MSRKLIDMTGKRTGMLTVVRRAEGRGKSVYWLCRCDCGTEKEMAASSLKSGTVSCGCHRRKVSSGLCGKLNLSHGKSRTKLYRVWVCMRDRCNNPNANAYPGYGGRGITICEEWEDFPAFESWALSSGYAPGLSIDRKDNDKGYAPDNCRWATQREQSNNRRSNRHLSLNGKTMTVSEWSRELGINRSTIHSRLRAGLPVAEALRGLHLFHRQKGGECAQRDG